MFGMGRKGAKGLAVALVLAAMSCGRADRDAPPPLAPATQALPLQAAHDERIVSHRLGLFEQVVELRIVLVHGALEPSPDRRRLGIVERPERPLELQHRLVPFADHLHSLAFGEGDLQAPPLGRAARAAG